MVVRVPRVDWARVLTGEKTELREAGRNAVLHQKVRFKPAPALGISYKRFVSQADSRMLIIEDAWQEPLGAISEESLRREGFDSIREFRHYWRERHQSVGFRPMSTVQVLRLRPMHSDDVDAMARAVLDRLYGPWLP